MRKLIIFIVLALFFFPFTVCADVDENGINYDAYKENWDILPENKENWQCAEYAIDYARNHPGWGFLVLSPFPNFKHQPHMVNYQINGSILKIYDPSFKVWYDVEITDGNISLPYHLIAPGSFSKEWDNPLYFHFEQNESNISISFVFMQDNRNEYFDYDNLTPITKIPTPMEWDGKMYMKIHARDKNTRLSQDANLSQSSLNQTPVFTNASPLNEEISIEEHTGPLNSFVHLIGAFVSFL